MGMKLEITINSSHASSVRPDLSKLLFTRIIGMVIFSFSPIRTDFAIKVTLSGRRGAEGHAVRVVGVIVVVRTTAVDVTEVVSVVSIPKPPVVGRQISILQNITNIIFREDFYIVPYLISTCLLQAGFLHIPYPSSNAWNLAQFETIRQQLQFEK